MLLYGLRKMAASPLGTVVAKYIRRGSLTMKTKILSFIILSTFAFTGLALAEETVEQVTETELENEHQTLDIQDTETGKEISKEEAKFVETQAKEARSKLNQTSAKRIAIGKKAKREVANNLWRQHTAQKKFAKDTAQTEALQAEIAKIEKEMDAALLARNLAEKEAAEARAKRNKERATKREHLANIDKNKKQKVQAHADIQKLEHEYLMVKAENKVLAEKARIADREASKKKAQAAALQQKIEKLRKRNVASAVPKTQVK